MRLGGLLRVAALVTQAVVNSMRAVNGKPMPRAWTDEEYERTAAMTSELALAVHRRLVEAEITIPFPQRDLLLASVSPEVRAVLSGYNSKD
jgi:hypothetical protein